LPTKSSIYWSRRDGPTAGILYRYCERFRAMIFEVCGPDAVRRYLGERRVALTGGDEANMVAIVPDQNPGLFYQSEQQRG